MQIIAEHKLTEFAQRHPTSRSGLFRWLSLMQQGNFGSVTALRETFRHADLVKKETPVQPKTTSSLQQPRNNIYSVQYWGQQSATYCNHAI